MAYRDPEAARRAKREWYRRKYQSDPDFRESEARRKAEWLEGNEQRKAVMRRYKRSYDKRKRED